MIDSSKIKIMLKNINSTNAFVKVQSKNTIDAEKESKVKNTFPISRRMT